MFEGPCQKGGDAICLKLAQRVNHNLTDVSKEDQQKQQKKTLELCIFYFLSAKRMITLCVEARL